jgi:CRISPR-associated protein Cas1
VDEWIWGQFNTGQLRAEHFGSDKGACLLGKAGRGYFYAGWEQFAPLPRRWLRQRCARLARELRSEGEAWLTPFDDEEEGF